ncbi:MAG: M61 family metallopeptidase [Crocinitomicaceae bacterium]
MKYTLTYDQPYRQNLKISATFRVIGANQITLNFPTWRPGRYELGNFAKNITQFNVVDDQGVPRTYSKTTNDEWVIETEDCQYIIVTYYYYASELNAGSTFIDDKQLYVNPVNCLIYNKNEQDLPCELTLNIPMNYEIACGLPFDRNKLITKDFHVLVDTPFIASPSLQHYSYKLGPLTVHLWFQGECKIDWARVKNDFIKFTRAQIKAFTKIPVDDYHFIYQITPYKTYHGVEHSHSTVIALGPSYQLMNEMYDDFLGVSSHEFYHTWNIKDIRPIEMAPYDYSKPNYSKLGYIAEGVTTYMGDLFLSFSKVKSWTWLKKELELLLTRHFENYGRFNYSVAESSWDTWLDGYVKGIPNRKVSIYNEGALIAFVIDIKIRHNSKNKYSLHDAMQQLYLQFGDGQLGYTEKNYIDTISQFVGENMASFFEKYAHTANSYESILAEAFETCGLELNTKPNPEYAKRLLGIKTINTNKGVEITDIIVGSTADLAGLMIGDIIISANDIGIDKNLSEWLKYFENDQITLTINRRGKVINAICPHTNRTYYPTYQLNKVKIPSSLQKRVFKKWCGYNFES